MIFCRSQVFLLCSTIEIKMGPKVKKPPKNAFSFFLDDYVQSLTGKGRQISRRIAAEECGPLWQELAPEEKENYKKRAASYKQYRKQDKINKFTCTGISFAELEREQEELRRKTEKADNEIKMTISNLDSELLKTHLFYIIHCNYYCKTDNDLYVPGELAIVEFNLEEGVRRTFHTLIDPGQIPLGFAFEAKKTIEEIHGLPYPPYDEGESDYLDILQKIAHFVEPGKLPDGRYPPFYTIENNIRASNSILQSLCESLGENKNHFRVYLLPKMFFWLKNTCVLDSEEENVGFPVLSSAESEISKDVFCFTPGISCPYHMSSEDKYHNCSLSVVQRFVYIVCDHCCQYLGVELVPGKHCRLKCDIDRKGTYSRIEKESNKQQTAEALSEIYERQSSYADDFSVFDWKKESAGCFLHDEIASKFSGLEISSVGSRSTKCSIPSFRGGFGRVGVRRQERKKEKDDEEEEEEEEDEEDENENFQKIMSLGRGISFR